MQKMVNRLENQNKPILYSIAYILGRGFGKPRSLSIRLPCPSFPQKYPQAWWKSFDSFRDGNLTGEAAKSPFQSGWKRFPTATSGFGSSKASRRRAHCHLALTSSDTTASSRRVRGNPGRSRLLSHQHRPPRVPPVGTG